MLNGNHLRINLKTANLDGNGVRVKVNLEVQGEMDCSPLLCSFVNSDISGIQSIVEPQTCEIAIIYPADLFHHG